MCEGISKALAIFSEDSCFSLHNSKLSITSCLQHSTSNSKSNELCQNTWLISGLIFLSKNKTHRRRRFDMAYTCLLETCLEDSSFFFSGLMTACSFQDRHFLWEAIWERKCVGIEHLRLSAISKCHEKASWHTLQMFPIKYRLQMHVWGNI